MMRPSVRPGASLALLLLAITALAGCANPSPPKCGSNCQSSLTGSLPTASSSGSTTQPSPVNASLPYFVFEKCHGLQAGFDVPGDKATQYFPADFRYQSGVPFTALFSLMGLQCERVVAQNTTLADVKIIWTSVAVDPKPETWRLTGQHYYTFDFLVSDARLVQRLRAIGVAVSQANVSVMLTDVGGQATREEWAVSSSLLTASLGFKHAASPQSGGNKHDLHSWMGEKSYSVLTIHAQEIQYALTGSDEDAVMFGGPSAFRKAVGDTATFGANTIANESWTIDSNLRMFKV